MIDKDKLAVGGWWMWILGLVVVSFFALSLLNYGGIFTKTVVEREVFENSFQYSQARKAEIATYTAQIAELEGQLANPSLDAGTQSTINAQLSAIRIQLNTARNMQ
jgi:hypothetical protein